MKESIQVPASISTSIEESVQVSASISTLIERGIIQKNDCNCYDFVKGKTPDDTRVMITCQGPLTLPNNVHIGADDIEISIVGNNPKSIKHLIQSISE